MDPLSIAASAITVAALATSTCRTFSELRFLCRTLPGRLHALNNEVVDTEIVLAQLAAVFSKRTSLVKVEEQRVTLELLSQARVALSQLQDILKGFAGLCDRSKFFLSQARAWRKEQPKLERLQDDIKRAKCTLAILLAASNSHDMLRIRLDIEQIFTITAQVDSRREKERAQFRKEIFSDLASHRDGAVDHLNELYHQVDERIAKVEGVLKASPDEAQLSPLRSMMVAQEPRPTCRQRMHHCSQKLPTTKDIDKLRSEGVRIRLRSQISCCSVGCNCVCHVTRKASTPAMVDRVLGQLSICYAGLPFFTAKCDSEKCRKSQSPWISLEYWFPLGYFWSQIFSLQVAYQANIGPQVSLSTLRRVPDTALSIKYALTGNIEGLQALFTRGLASPVDVDSTRGYSLLSWASYAMQFNTCRFLVHAGADPNHRPNLKFTATPISQIFDYMLQGRLSQKDMEVLSCVIQGSNFIGEEGYTQLHRVILGLSMENLEEVISMHPESINAVDARGRSPLTWAASRGDEHAISLLLEAGADPNTFDTYGDGVITHAAENDRNVCIRLLLEANAEFTPALPTGKKLTDALIHTTRYATKLSSLKQLLDSGADVNASTTEGWTPLYNVARLDKVDFARLLLDYGANINATSTCGQTILTTAITYNSHNVLKLLLHRWRDFGRCPRHQGPNLLQIAALHADIETINILTTWDHLVSRSDRVCIIGDFATRLHERLDVTDELIDKFEELITIVGREPNTCEAIQNQSELEHRTPSEKLSDIERLGRHDTESHDDESGEVFIDALEELEIEGDI